MTKKTFLSKLRKDLSILKEEEREDIINEYKDIIEEKVKHGKTESDAVLEFGDYGVLVSGILDAYKINVTEKDSKTKDKTKEILSTGEEMIRKGAKKLAEEADRIVSDMKSSHTEITLELIFELILKGLCFLIIMSLLTIPFRIFMHIGVGILDFTFFPIDMVLKVLWKIMIGILYFVSGILICLAFFKDYIKKPNQTIDKPQKKNNKVNKAMEKKVEPLEENSHYESKFFHFLITIFLKIFIIVTCIIPMTCMIIFLLFLFSFSISLLCKGLDVIGFLIGSLGGIALLILCIDFLYNGLFHHKKMNIYPFLFSIVMMVTGFILTIDFITRIEYIDTLPNAIFKKEYVSYDYVIQGKTKIDADYQKIDFKIDPTLKDGEMKILIYYYEDYGTPSVETYQGDNEFCVDVYRNSYFEMGKVINLFIDHLRENRIYDYGDLSNVDIKIITNEKTKKRIYLD